MNKIWNVSKGGSISSEDFVDVTEAMNQAKRTSLSNFCTFLHTSNKKFFVFENGDLANQRRAAELSKQTEEAILAETTREMKKNTKRKK